MSGPKGFTSFNSTCNFPGTLSGLKTSKKSQNPARLTGWFPFWKWMIRMSNAKWSLPFMVQTFPEHQPVPVYMKIWNSGYQLVQPPAFAIIWNNASLALPSWNQKNYHPTRGFFTSAQSQHDFSTTSDATYGYLDERDLAPSDQSCAPNFALRTLGVALVESRHKKVGPCQILSGFLTLGGCAWGGRRLSSKVGHVGRWLSKGSRFNFC